MQEHATDQLCIKGTQTQGALGSLAAVCKRFRQNRIKRFTARNAVFIFRCLRKNIFIAQRLKFRLQRIYLGNNTTGGFNFTVVGSAKHLLSNRS